MSVSSASLAGKVAFVQGGSRGIGAAIVRRLAAEGASVAFTYVSSADKSRALAAELEGAGASILALTKGLARDLGPRGITVNNVQPGPVDTDMNPDDGDFAEVLKGLMALPRYARSEEIASFVAYLAGPEAAYITGASLTIDGGFSA